MPSSPTHASSSTHHPPFARDDAQRVETENDDDENDENDENENENENVVCTNSVIIIRKKRGERKNGPTPIEASIDRSIGLDRVKSGLDSPRLSPFSHARRVGRVRTSAPPAMTMTMTMTMTSDPTNHPSNGATRHPSPVDAWEGIDGRREGRTFGVRSSVSARLEQSRDGGEPRDQSTRVQSLERRRLGSLRGWFARRARFVESGRRLGRTDATKGRRFVHVLVTR